MARKLTRTVLASAAISVGSATLAQGSSNLVTNGSFETGDFSGWTLTGDTSLTGVCATSSCPGMYAPIDGNFAAFFGNIGDTATLSQTIATPVGQTWKIDFWLADQLNSGGSYFIEVDWGTTTLTGYKWNLTFDWTELSFFATSTNPLTPLSFTFENDQSNYIFLDNVQVYPTPEPGSLTLTSAGVVGIISMLRRKLGRRA